MRLGFNIERQENDYLATPPSFRRDIELEADLIEEIARVYGYNNIPSVMPEVSLAINKVSDKHKNLGQLRDFLCYAGFTETINYSFAAKEDFELFDIPTEDERRKAVTVINPLQRDYGILRTFLLPALLRNMKYNIGFGAKEVNIYETGTVFFDMGSGFPRERHKLAVLSYSSGGKKLYPEPAAHFFSIKGLLESILTRFRCVNYESKPSVELFLENGQAVDIFIANEKVGFLGQLSAETAMGFEIIDDKPDIAVFEIYIDKIISEVKDEKDAGIGHKKIELLYSTNLMIKYPSIERDMAIVVDEACQSGDIINLIKSEHLDPERLIESVEIFDQYKGKNIPDGKKSLAYHIVYRSKERTLLDSEIETLYTGIVKYVIDETGATLRE
ncbi:MAG: hypothetical protein HQL01_15480 [Nitrospirae bacterium]|nr:hypothetical protein [Nitrospirota bacterium]